MLQIKARRQKLPKFEAADTRKIIAIAKKIVFGVTPVAMQFVGKELSGGATLTPGLITEALWIRAIDAALHHQFDAQIMRLVQTLGLDSSKSIDWFEAFSRLAMIHHGVGRMVHHRLPQATRPQRNVEDDIVRVLVAQMQEQSISQRAALRKLAVENKFSYQERRDHKESRGSAERSTRSAAIEAKVAALRRRYLRQKKCRGEPLVYGTLVEIFEMLLCRWESVPKPHEEEERPLTQPLPSGDTTG